MARSGEIVRDRLDVGLAKRIRQKAARGITVTGGPGQVLDQYPPRYFNPNRFGCEAPVWASRTDTDLFKSRLREIDPSLGVSWHPIRNRWQIWKKNPNSTYGPALGWSRLFMCDFRGDYVPLGPVVLAEIGEVDASRYGGAEKYMRRVASEEKRAEEMRELEKRAEARDIGGQIHDHFRPSVGYGSSGGSKTTTFG